MAKRNIFRGLAAVLALGMCMTGLAGCGSEKSADGKTEIEDIAAVCGINRSYFGKIFRNSTGRSPQEFLMNYRMVKATELLKLTSLSIADVGSAVGYENQLHFSRAFKNIYGVSPREWRKQNK